ncbi:response regulator [Desulfofustis limnaeus]|uniref:response regulator n=1 Tax=Desulfofustis limnaeus TaxID=2740163 RepID=UPI0024DFE809|nr:response regulator [Desulfofustis limnaeus]MDX9893970.1 response regulator [Desulfofustis sp.]
MLTSYRFRILLAEDDPINQMAVKALLDQLGLSVVCVQNGREVVDEVTRNSYDLILMDLQMPDVDGFQATRLIRQMAGAAGRTPIVALTAHAQEKDRDRCLHSGMNEFLSKPVDSNRLKRILSIYLKPPRRHPSCPAP